ncbi:MAG: AmmeMemoRadiSam system protein B [bacterium]
MNTKSQIVRTALGAGKWFPGSPAPLRQTIAEQLENAFIPEVPDPIVAVIAPHAGYVYSGPTAAYTYRTIQENSRIHGTPDTVVILGFSHREPIQGVALMDGDAFSTPLGLTPLDKDSANLLVNADSRIAFDYRPHMGEHSLENQIPFIQTVLPSVSLVMAMIGPRDMGLLNTIATTLKKLANKKKILVVASSDMLHDDSYEKVRKTDQASLRKVVGMDIQGIMHDWDFSHQIFCGIGPVITAMFYAQQQGCKKATLLRYRNSGDDFPEGRGEWVVGYGAVAFTA